MGRNILITGGLGAIAEHIVNRFLIDGDHLFLIDRVSPGEARTVIDRKWPGSSITYCEADLTDESAIDSALNGLCRQHEISIAICNAGGTPLQPFMDASVSEFESTLHFNFTAQTRLTRTLLGIWKEAGRCGQFIYLSSWVARIPYPELPAYCCAKAALEMFCKCMAVDYGKQGYRFNCVAPGVVRAGSALKVYKENRDYRERTNKLLNGNPLTPPERIASCIFFLASDEGTAFQGQCLAPDDGISLPFLAN